MSSQLVDTPERMNVLGPALLLNDSPLKNRGLETNVLGSFVNRACQDRCRLEEVKFPPSDGGRSSWQNYFDNTSSPSAFKLFVVTPEGNLKLGMELIEFIRTRLQDTRYRNL